jgi:Peptidase A4 family
MDKHNRRRVRLCVEELEGRLVPSGLKSLLYSSNWSGYAVTEVNNNTVTEVSGEWTVPTVTGKTTGYSSTWVGIDGFSSDSVEQIGTEADMVKVGKNYVAQYTAWWELYGSSNGFYETPISMTIEPGDTITAYVQYTGTSNGNDVFTLSITDVTRNTTFTTSQQFVTDTADGFTPPQLNSAEWIEEAPSGSNGVLPLANFGSVTINYAYMNGNPSNLAAGTIATGYGGSPIGSFHPAAFDSSGNTTQPGYVAMDMADFGFSWWTGYYVSKVLDSTSALSTNGEAFTVAYGATTPAAPSGTSAGSSKKGEALELFVLPQSILPAGITTGQLSVATASRTDQVTAVNLDAAANQAQSQAVSAFFAINPTVGGMDGAVGTWLPGTGPSGDGMSGDNLQAAPQWLTPSPGTGEMAPPAVAPPPQTPENMDGFGAAQDETASTTYRPGATWKGDPGSTRERPGYGAELIIDQSAVFVLLGGAALNDRRRNPSADAE